MITKKKLLLITAIALGSLAVAAFIGYSLLNSSPMTGDAFLFQIKPGDGFYAVAEELSKKGAIRSLRFFKTLGSLRGASTKMKAGFYQIDKDASSSEILDRFLDGKVYTVRVTVPEGIDNKHVARIMARHRLCTEAEFLKVAGDGTILAKFGLEPQKSTEGFLFPDTYLVPWGASPRQIVDMMIGAFKHNVGKDLLAKMKASPIGFYNTIVLASIVEREAVAAHERARIAGVFMNRFKTGMKFESCATIQYMLGEVQQKLYYYQLKMESPYNTYIHPGFPPGPIANPGVASLKAAAEPEQHKFLYFVSKNDGTHVFSSSGRDHNRAASLYQWNGR